MENINLDLLNDFKYISGLQSNPKKDAFAYIVKNVNLDKNTYDTSLYLYKDKKNICLIEKQSFNFHGWLTDKSLLISKNDEKDKNITQFYNLTLGEGESKKIFSIPYPVNSIKKISDTKYILSIEKTLKKDEDFSVVIEQIPFFSNGASYTNYKRNQLFVYDSITNELKKISEDDDFNVIDFDIDKNSMKVVYLGNIFENKMQLYSNVYEYDLEKNMTTTLCYADISFNSCKYLKYYVLLFGSDMKKFGINELEKVYYLDRKTHELNIEINEDIDYGNSTGSDARLGHNETVLVNYTDNSFYFVQTVENHTRLSLYSNKNITTILEFMGSIDGYVYIDNTLYTLSFVDGKIAEIYMGTNLEKITSFNDEVFKNRYISKANEIDFISNNAKIKGFVLLPQNYDKNKKYKAILDIHGGPMTVYSPIYYHEMQVLTSLGYIVMYTNPHGSSGRGNLFADIRGKYGSIDYEDLMNFVDTVIEKYSIDTENIGVTGGSYGGFMTNWIVTHTDRFKCAVTQRSISNWISMYGVSDIGYYFSDDQNKTKFNDENFFNVLWNHSPLKYIKSCKTPLLIIHSDCDYRCPIDQGYQMLTALLDMGIDAKMVVFKGENHELSRSGKPKARISRLQNMVDWFNKYLN